MAARIGIDCKLYYKLGGQAAGGSWTEIPDARDLTLAMDKDEADVSRRGVKVKMFRGALLGIDPEWDQIWNKGAQVLADLRDSYLNDTLIGLRILDGVNGAGGEGIEGDFIVFKYEREEKMNGEVALSVGTKTADSTPAPHWVST